MENNSNKNTGLKIPPPVYYIAALLIGVTLQYFFPITLLSSFWNYCLGIGFTALSFTIIPFVIIRYRKSKTPFDVSKSASTLITDGPNHYSRNPGYLSLTLLYLGIGFMLNNFWILGLSIPLITAIDFHVIRKEESHLTSIFGQEYLQYKATVRRWI